MLARGNRAPPLRVITLRAWRLISWTNCGPAARATPSVTRSTSRFFVSTHPSSPAASSPSDPKRACQTDHHHQQQRQQQQNPREQEQGSIAAAVQQASKLLPQQAILENFIHHNPLHDFETLPFREALDHASKLESYMSPGERLFALVRVDPRKRVNESLVDLSSAFLDRGGAKWACSFRHKGFLHFFATLEGLGHAPWRAHARAEADRVLKELQSTTTTTNTTTTTTAAAATTTTAAAATASTTAATATTMLSVSGRLSEEILRTNLEFFGVPREEWTHAIRATLLELRGWAGMFLRMQTHPSEAPPDASVALLEFAAVQSILARSSIAAIARECGWPGEQGGVSLAAWLERAPTLRQPDEGTALHASAIAFVDQDLARREQNETEFEHTLLHALRSTPTKSVVDHTRPTLQLLTCIDDRECSFRRHVEEVCKDSIETFGVAGFFGIPIRYLPADGREEMVLAPEGQTPFALLTESEFPADHDKSVSFHRRRRVLAQAQRVVETLSFSATGSLLLSTLFPVNLLRLITMGFLPAHKSVFKERLELMLLPKPRTDFSLPCTPQEAAAMLARTLKDIGREKNFATVVLVLGHGATSVNNPFAAAYNCGACGGRQGGPNARVMARLGNDKDVRDRLSREHNIIIPPDTVFVGGAHNTTADTVEFFDVELLPETHRAAFAKVEQTIAQALGRNALERCHRFLLANDVRTPEDALRHVHSRATDPAEVRPELNHSTNAAVVIGRRELTKGRFLDRRCFLPSYDPYNDDERGTNLEHVLAPALVVCSGINLEYLFSTISVDHHGAGTKAPLNIVGNIGVLQGTAGDLRPGLPSQMTEMHVPVRALFMVDAPVDRVEAVLARRPELKRLVRNEWVRLIVRDPPTGHFYKQSQGEYLPVDRREMDKPFVPFEHHRNHGMQVAGREKLIYYTTASAMAASCAVPIWLYMGESMNPYGPAIAVFGTLLSLPILSFSRRYLHGEFMFGRFAHLCAGLALGFNLVATAPTLGHAMAGWSLFGFASTFLIGAYNDRPTVRNNATFAFMAYRLSDLALLIATTFSTQDAVTGYENPELVAAGLVTAALLKSSQFPLNALFARSMEGPTPASALGYAGLSAHVGTVLLAGTMPLWFGFDWARAVVGVVGGVTAMHGTLVSKTRAERKGAIANATSATVGLLLVCLSLGQTELSLLLSLGHAALRMRQILLSPSTIADAQDMRSALGYSPWPKPVPDWLYRLSWRLRRLDNDAHVLHLFHRLGGRLASSRPWKLGRTQQWALTSLAVVLAGAPFTPLSHYEDELLMELLPHQPHVAVALMAAHFVASVGLVRFLLVNVLNTRRFQRPSGKHEAGK
jgi:uncharacterized protein YbcC (UPF0753/DUF2309 family)